MTIIKELNDWIDEKINYGLELQKPRKYSSRGWLEIQEQLDLLYGFKNKLKELAKNDLEDYKEYHVSKYGMEAEKDLEEVIKDAIS
jgi:hypothetical protein